MAPVLQRRVALTICVLFCRLLLGQVPFAIVDNLSHVTKIVFPIFRGIFPWILLQDLNDLAATGPYYQLLLSSSFWN